MNSLKEIDNELAEYKKSALQSIKHFESQCKSSLERVGDMNGVEQKHLLNLVFGTIEDGYKNTGLYNMPKINRFYQISSGKFESILSLTLSAKSKGGNTIKQSIEVALGEFAYDDLLLFYDNFVSYVFYTEKAEDNLQGMNYRLCELVTNNGLSLFVEFVSTERLEPLVSISDTKVVLKCNLWNALSVLDKGIIGNIGQSETTIEQEFIKVLSKVANAPSLLVADCTLLRELSYLNINMRADKTIRRSYHRKIENTKQGEIGYYKVQSIFALLKNNNGSNEIILSPFNVRDYTNVGSLA